MTKRKSDQITHEGLSRLNIVQTDLWGLDTDL